MKTFVGTSFCTKWYCGKITDGLATDLPLTVLIQVRGTDKLHFVAFTQLFFWSSQL